LQVPSGRVEDHDRRITPLKDIDVVVRVDSHVAVDAVLDVCRQYAPAADHGVPPITEKHDKLTHGRDSSLDSHPVIEPSHGNANA
jgi:hypothetical protein